MKNNQDFTDPLEFDEFGDTQLHHMAKNGDVKGLKLLITSRNVDATNTNGETPLHIAAKYGKLESVNCLLKSGASVKSLDKDGNTPLHSAVSLYSNTQMVTQKLIIEFLIKAGANIEARNSGGFSPLNLAVQSKTAPILKCLLTEGADIDSENADGYTALHNALFYGNTKTANFLLDNGCSVNSNLSLRNADYIDCKYVDNFKSLVSNLPSEHREKFNNIIFYEKLRDYIDLWRPVHLAFSLAEIVCDITVYSVKYFFSPHASSYTVDNPSYEITGASSTISDNESDS